MLTAANQNFQQAPCNRSEVMHLKQSEIVTQVRLAEAERCNSRAFRGHYNASYGVNTIMSVAAAAIGAVQRGAMGDKADAQPAKQPPIKPVPVAALATGRETPP